MGQRTPNSEGPCEPLEREVVHLESQLSGLQNRLHRLLDPRRPPPEAAIRLEDEIDKVYSDQAERVSRMSDKTSVSAFGPVH